MDYWYDAAAAGEAEAAERWALREQHAQRGAARRRRIEAAGGPWVRRQAERARRRERALAGSAFWASCRAALRAAAGGGGAPPEELVCYGLGPLELAAGGWQLALLLLLAAELGIAPGAVLCYDPAHTPQEEAALAACGVTPLRADERALRACAVPTLFYMPHCPYPLYNNLVCANWRAPWRLSWIGNDLSFHALHNHPFATVAPHLHRAMRVLDTARLPDTFEPQPEEEGDDEHDEDDGAPVSSTQIFGLSALYTFPPRKEWLAAEPGEPLANWLADGPPELPTQENLEARSENRNPRTDLFAAQSWLKRGKTAGRLEKELAETRARAEWLAGRLQLERRARL